MGNQVKTPVELGERADPEKVDLENFHGLDVVLFPLDNSSFGHGRVLDRYHLMNRTGGEHKSTGMNGQMPRKVDDGIGQCHQQAMYA